MSKYFTVEASFSYTLTESGEGITDFLDAVTEHLDALGAEDTFIVADEAAQEFTMSFMLSGKDDRYDAFQTGSSTLRTAFHHCNAETPGWPKAHEALMALNVFESEVRVLANA